MILCNTFMEDKWVYLILDYKLGYLSENYMWLLHIGHFLPDTD